MKGFDYKVNVGPGDLHNNVRINYLEVPLNLQCTVISIPKISKVFIGAGPYIGYAIGGEWEHTFLALPTDKHKLRIGNSGPDDIKPLDFGVNLNVGFRLNFGPFLRLQYSVGLVNISTLSTTTAMNKNLSISAG